MDRDRSALRTTSKLEVFAPSPTVLNPQDRTSEIRRQRRLRRRKKSGLESPTPVPEVQTNRLSQSGSPPNDSNVESVQESYEPEIHNHWCYRITAQLVGEFCRPFVVDPDFGFVDVERES